MGRKSTIQAYQFFDSADLSGNLESASFNVKNLDKASLRLSWTSADALGEFKIQARQELESKTDDTEGWFDLEFGNTIPLDATSQSDHQILFNELPFVELRIVYTATSGSGTLNGKLTAKVVGA